MFWGNFRPNYDFLLFTLDRYIGISISQYKLCFISVSAAQLIFSYCRKHIKWADERSVQSLHSACEMSKTPNRFNKRYITNKIFLPFGKPSLFQPRVSSMGRSYMFSVHNPGKMFSEHVLGTRAFILWALWNVLGIHSFRLKMARISVCAVWRIVHTLRNVWGHFDVHSVLIAVCVLSPTHLEHCSRYTSVHTCFGCVLRGRFVPRTWFDHVLAGTVLAETILFRTRSDYKKWCVPRTCSENMFLLELYREQVWTPGMSHKHLY